MGLNGVALVRLVVHQLAASRVRAWVSACCREEGIERVEGSNIMLYSVGVGARIKRVDSFLMLFSGCYF